MCNATATRIAIFDGDIGMLDLYREIVDDEGSAIVVHADAAQLDAASARRLLHEVDPQCVIWDVAPPYTPCITLLRELLDGGDLDRRTLLVTTTDKPQVDTLLHDANAIVLGKPFDIDEVTALLKRGTACARAP